jgi:phage terminase Nu1 subunit (DNA packaging protein)
MTTTYDESEFEPVDVSDEFEPDPDDGDPFIVRKHGLAKITGLTVEELDHHVRKGCPVYGDRKRGAQLIFDIRAAVPWIIGRLRATEGVEGAKRRQADATARRAEAQAAKIAGELVPLDTIAAAFRDAAAVWRGELLSLPARCPVDAQAEVKVTVDALINSIAEKAAALVETKPS